MCIDCGVDKTTENPGAGREDLCICKLFCDKPKVFYFTLKMLTNAKYKFKSADLSICKLVFIKKCN